MGRKWFHFYLCIVSFPLLAGEEAAPLDLSLDRSAILVAPMPTVRDKFVKIILSMFQNDVSKPLDLTLQSLNDPKRPIAMDFSFSQPVLQILFKRNREWISSKLNEILKSPTLVSKLLDEYEQHLSNTELGVDGELRIFPRIEKATLEIDKKLTPQEIENEAKFKTLPLNPGEVPLTRSDFQLEAQPRLSFSNLNFYTIERPSPLKHDLPALQLDLSDIALGRPSWFYVISNLEQVFKRKEEQARLSEKILGFNSEDDAYFQRLEDFTPRLSGAEAVRVLKDDLRPEDWKSLIGDEMKVLIYSTKSLNGDWVENWIWDTPEGQDKILRLQSKRNLGYLVQGKVAIEEREAPFQFKERWFGSNLAPNYLSEKTADAVVEQIFTNEMWSTFVDMMLHSPSLAALGHKLVDDLNNYILPKLKETQIQIWIYGEKSNDGTVVARYELSEESYKNSVEKSKTSGSIVYAGRVSFPLAIKSVRMGVSPPFRIQADLYPEEEIPVTGELYYVQPKSFSFGTLGVNGILKDFLERLPGVDFSEAPLRVSARLSSGTMPASLSVPLTWHDQGPDVDADQINVSLKLLDDTYLKDVTLHWPHQPDRPIRLDRLETDLANFLRKGSPQEVRALLQASSESLITIVNKRLSETFNKMTVADRRTPVYVADVSDAQKKTFFKASFFLEKSAIPSEWVHCRPEFGDDSNALPAQFAGLSVEQKALVQLPSVMTFSCDLRLPKNIRILVKDLETEGGSISAARAIFHRASDDPVKIKLKVVKDGSNRLWVVPISLDPAAILASYEPNVAIPSDSVISGVDWIARRASGVKSTAVHWSEGGWLTKYTGIQMASRAAHEAISDKEIATAREKILAGWNENRDKIAENILSAAFYQIPSINRSSFRIVSSETFAISDKSKASSLVFYEESAGRRISDFVHQKLHIEPFQNQAVSPSSFDWMRTQPWKEYVRREVFQIPYYASEAVNSALFQIIQRRAFEPISDQVNKTFREDLQPQIAKAASSLLLKSRTIALPQVGSVCLVRDSSPSGIANTYNVLIAAEANSSPVVQIPESKLPAAARQQSTDGHFYLSLGYGLLNEVLETNQDSIRALLEDAMKYEEDPVTQERKARAFIDAKNFKVNYIRARFEEEDGSPVLVIDTRLAQPFKMISKALPLIGEVVQLPFKPLLDLDTKNIQIRITPDAEVIRFTEGLGGSEIKFQNRGTKPRELRLQPKTFRSLLTSIVLKGVRKKIKSEDLTIPMDAKVVKNSVDYNLRQLQFEKNWLTVDIEPVLDVAVHKPFKIELRYPQKSDKSD